MTHPAPRDRQQRTGDTLAMLAAPAADVWVATASGSGSSANPYLVPLSLAWIDERVVIAVDSSSRTARNIEGSRTARLAVGPTRDVVVIDARLEHSVPVTAAQELAERYVQQADWDPRTAATPTSSWSCDPSASRRGERSMNSPAGPLCGTEPGSPDPPEGAGRHL